MDGNLNRLVIKLVNDVRSFLFAQLSIIVSALVQAQAQDLAPGLAQAQAPSPTLD